ncbi:MAG: c-type cytochrome [Cyclobacteriaceae bacterium]|nr:c-type cytochrome [Cyclobacteriaceae bacterium]
MKKLMIVLIAAATLAACAPDKPKMAENMQSKKSAVTDIVDPTKGIGQVKNVTLHNPLDADRIQRGQDIFDMKCSACHQLTDQRIVGPGFKDITKRRKPEWIMNMITNVDVMLDEDPVAQELLELCLMRMPNQNVSIGDARDILEFMRKNDGEE